LPRLVISGAGAADKRFVHQSHRYSQLVSRPFSVSFFHFFVAGHAKDICSFAVALIVLHERFSSINM
jgi:hypothetical protein